MIKHETEQLLINGELVDIDINCIPMVKFFNEIGLTTKFSCEGNSLNTFNIIFADEVTDKQIEEFLFQSQNISEYGHSFGYGTFSKWVRVISGEIKSNWVYKVHNVDLARDSLMIMKGSANNGYSDR